MKSMKAPATIKDIYVRHVAIAVNFTVWHLYMLAVVYFILSSLQRKYIRSLSPDSKNNFSWISYRKWLQLYYPNEETIDWVEIIVEDEAVVYHSGDEEPQQPSYNAYEEEPLFLNDID